MGGECVCKFPFQKSIKVKLGENDMCTVSKVYENNSLPKDHKLKIWKVL